MTTEPPKYRLVYFDVRALAEPIRWIFHYTGTPFVDDRIPWDNPAWHAGTKQKYRTTVGHIPVLFEEGKPELGQSHAISRYLAKKFGLTGRNDFEDAKVDELIGQIFDLYICWRVMLIFERDPERKKMNRGFVDHRFELCYTAWNKWLEESGGPFAMGEKLTHADFWLASFLNIWDDPMEGDGPVMSPGFIMPSQSDTYLGYTKNFPALKAHKERVMSLPKIKEWVEKRHKTQA